MMAHARNLTRAALMGAALATLAGCAGTPMTITCAPFRTDYAAPVPSNKFIAAITDDVNAGLMRQQSVDPLELLRDDIMNDPVLQNKISEQVKGFASLQQTMGDGSDADGDAGVTAGGPIYLLLSGGGQWGAYGAAFLEALHKQGGDSLPRPAYITGVSTGGLQALFVGAHASQPNGKWLTNLREQYSPQSESDVVDRGGLFRVVFGGSVAKLGPLRAKIEKALCSKATDPSGTGPLAAGDCPLIMALADPDADHPVVLLGFVEANSGELQYVEVGRIARGVFRGADQSADAPLPLRERQQCLTAAAMASAAVPVQYQQLRIRSREPGSTSAALAVRTYLDGGVRQSVFAVIAPTMVKLVAQSAGLPAETGDDGRIFVVRNGPTDAPVDEKPDQSASAYRAALRSYQLIVNQSEVTSIAALRLNWPTEPMHVTTADGHGRFFVDPNPEIDLPEAPNIPGRREWDQGCVKDVVDRTGTKSDDDIMFNPWFMRCLRAFGRHKASLPWNPEKPPHPKELDRWINMPKVMPPRPAANQGSR